MGISRNETCISFGFYSNFLSGGRVYTWELTESEIQ
nr:MAG TPA: hypothetical protein [Caudoviricetes sp.]